MGRRAMFGVLALVLAAVGTSAAAQDVGALRIVDVELDAYPQVTVTTTITAPPDAADRSDALRILEDGDVRPGQVTQAASEDLQVVLLIDTTGSMGGPPMQGAREAATAFVERLPDDVALSVIGYDTETTVVTGFDDARSEHLAGIAGLEPDGRTAMYDAIASTLDLLEESRTDQARQAIILLTDGEDNASETALPDLVERVEGTDVTLQGVEYLTAFTDEAGIRALAEASGGQTFEADEADALRRIYEDLASDLVNTYQLSYTSETSGPTEVTVELENGDEPLRATRTVDLPEPEAPAPDDEGPDDAPATDTAVPLPTEPRSTGGTWLLIGGAAAWFLALALVLLSILAPRETRGQLSGAASRLRRGRAGGEVAERVTLLTEDVLRRRGYERGLNAALERAGIDLRPGEFIVSVASAAVVAGAIGRLLGGWLVAMLFVVATVLVARMYVSIRGDRRCAAFADQLSDTLQLLAGSLRAGYSLMQAIDAVAREADSPTAEEFGRVVVETRLGRDTDDAFGALADRMATEDFGWVVQAIQIHREVGGDLAEVLDTVGETIRDRDQIRRQVKALSAEGRLSAYILLALPFAVAGLIYMSNPSYLAELTHGGLLGWGLIGTGLALMTVGAVWIKKLVKVEF